MDPERSWAVIEAQRRGIADLLESLTVVEWEAPSLCSGWRVRDVAAHLALAPQAPGPASMFGAAVRASGSFHRLNHDLAVRHAQRPPEQLVAELREHAASRRLPMVTNYRNILFDVLVHGQDIALPLNRRHSTPPEAARAAAERIWSMGWPFWARRRLRPWRLSATDVSWSVGRGPEIEGPIAALLLLLTGRPAALPLLTGAGVGVLAERLAPPSG